MPTDLSDSDREEKEVERLIDKKPAPSRKKTERRGPKHDNRRDRINELDKDLQKTDRDMSLNYKVVGSNLADIALRVLIAAPKSGRPKSERPKDVDPKGPLSNLKNQVNLVSKKLKKFAPSVSNSFDSWSKDHFIAPAEWDESEIEKGLAELQKILDSLKSVDEISFKNVDNDSLAKFVTDNWPSKNPIDWVGRANLIRSLKSAIDRLDIPSSFKAPFLRGKKADNSKLIQDILDDVEKGVSKKSLNGDEIVRFAHLASIYQIISSNPTSVNSGSLTNQVDKLVDGIFEKIDEVSKVTKVMETWNDIMVEFSKNPLSVKKPDMEQASKSLEKFERRSQKGEPSINTNELISLWRQNLEKKYGEVPKEFSEAFPRAASIVSRIRFCGATSNEDSGNKAMVQKTSMYHGVLQQEPPSGRKNTDPRLYDRRYFDETHYKSIIKCAKDFLGSDWLTHSWDGSTSDARYRAALDMAIGTADFNLYQSKIDSETYDMLLNRLASWDYDQFSETVVPKVDTSKRSASSMRQTHFNNILRVASALKDKDPKMAFDIVKSLRSLVALDSGFPGKVSQEEQQEEQTPGKAAQEQQAQQEVTSQEQQSQQEQQAGAPVSDKEMDAFVKGEVDLKDLGKNVDKLVKSTDIEDFLSGLKDLKDVIGKTAGKRARFAGLKDLDMSELAPLADMSDEDVKKFLDSMKKCGKDLDGAVKDGNIEKFLTGMDEILAQAKKEADKVRTSSVRINLSTLVKLAHSHPATRPVLMPILLAAKKKKDKKPAKKQSQESKESKKDSKEDSKAKSKDGKKKSPFGDKKAPPFGKKPVGKKKKASDIILDDTNW